MGPSDSKSPTQSCEAHRVEWNRVALGTLRRLGASSEEVKFAGYRGVRMSCIASDGSRVSRAVALALSYRFSLPTRSCPSARARTQFMLP